MVTKKKLLKNELMKEIVSVRVDALWKMLKQKKTAFFQNHMNLMGVKSPFDQLRIFKRR